MKMVDSILKSIEEKKTKRHERKLARQKADAEYKKEQLEKEQLLIKKEEEKIKMEHDRLSSLSDRELKIETIMAIRGLYYEHKMNVDAIEELMDRIEDAEADISYLESEIMTLKTSSHDETEEEEQ